MKHLFTFLVLLSSINCIFAQVDPHFSQYYVYPSYLNPALTGAFNGSIRISGIFRNQWGNIASPFSTKGISTDISTEKNINIGFGLLNQSAGNASYNYTTSHLNFAYTGLKFGSEGYGRVTFGIQTGLIDRRFNRARLSFGDQFNPVTGYSSSNPTSDILENYSSTSLDLGTGVLFYDANPENKVNIYAGASVSHLTKVKDNFFSTGDNYLPLRLIGHIGARITLSEFVSFTPNALFLTQGNAREMMLGAYCNIIASTKNELLLGLNYRLEDAISPFVGITFNSTIISFSYDINTSLLGRQVSGANAFEMSISFFKLRKIKTPELDFVCPRL